MLEHVGPENYAALGRVIDRSLGPHGRGLVHSIGRVQRRPMDAWIERHIFPGAYSPTLEEMVGILSPHDLAVLDVEDLRLHYERTLEHWLERFEKNSAAIERRFDARFVRMWRLYLAGSIAVVPHRQPAALAGRVRARARERDPVDARAPVRAQREGVARALRRSDRRRRTRRARPARGALRDAGLRVVGARREAVPARQGLRGLDHAADRGRARARPRGLREEPRAAAVPRLRGEHRSAAEPRASPIPRS